MYLHAGGLGHRQEMLEACSLAGLDLQE